VCGPDVREGEAAITKAEYVEFFSACAKSLMPESVPSHDEIAVRCDDVMV
jgi:hypothetical protein